MEMDLDTKIMRLAEYAHLAWCQEMIRGGGYFLTEKDGTTPVYLNDFYKEDYIREYSEIGVKAALLLLEIPPEFELVELDKDEVVSDKEIRAAMKDDFLKELSARVIGIMRTHFFLHYFDFSYGASKKIKPSVINKENHCSKENLRLNLASQIAVLKGIGFDLR